MKNSTKKTPARKSLFCRISPTLHRKFAAVAKAAGRDFVRELEVAMERHIAEAGK